MTKRKKPASPSTGRGTADPAKRAEALRDLIRRYEHAYYVLDQPEVSDAEFDVLFLELRRIELEHPDLVTPDSPTQRVCLLYTSPSPRDRQKSRMPSSA